MAAKERAMKLLGRGIEQEVVATALGITPSAISQFLSEPEFASAVAELRLLNLEGATDRDGKYDELEDQMLDKMKETVGFMTKPREIAGVLAVLNKAVRRGVRPENAPQVKQDVVVLNFPRVIHQQFVTNHVNQVIAVGGNLPAEARDLTTISAKGLLEQVSRIPLPQQKQFEDIRDGHERRETVLEGEGSRS